MTLYPEIEPYSTHILQVSDLHTIYVEESGNPDGIPVIRCHGGPGSPSGAKPGFRQTYDPKVWRIILFAQRGCGQSTPLGEMQENTTDLLVEDIETIRDYLNIEQWVVAGASRGTTLALVYAQQYPERVLGLLLNSICLFTHDEIARILDGGAQDFFPQERHELMSYLPDDLDMPVHEYLCQYFVHNDTYDEQLVKAVAVWLGTAIKHLNKQLNKDVVVSERLLASLKIFFHYVAHDGFLHDNQILKNIDKIRHIPCIMLHGRYDIECVPKVARELAQARPEATFELIEGAGHRTSDPALQKRVVERGDLLAKNFSKKYC